MSVESRLPRLERLREGEASQPSEPELRDYWAGLLELWGVCHEEDDHLRRIALDLASRIRNGEPRPIEELLSEVPEEDGDRLLVEL